MNLINYEFKARLKNERRIRAALKALRARFVGVDHQVDTYFRVQRGRLKVREGRFENALIFYQRANLRRARESRVRMLELLPRSPMKEIFARALGVLAVVDKRREIYFAGNVKVQLDRVRGLGRFVEVEAISRRGNVRKIRQQARRFQQLFAIAESEVVAESYSELVLSQAAGSGRKIESSTG
jgi:adenylate cyclase class 2